MKISRLAHALKLGFESIQGVCLVGIVLLILASIIMRNFFNVGLVWVFEATGFLMVWMVFLGAPRNLIDHGEIRVDTLVQMMNARMRGLLWLFQKTVVLLTSIIVVVYFAQHAMRFGGLASPTLKIPQLIFFGAVAIGPFFAVLVTLGHLVQFLKGKFPDEWI